MSLRDFLGKIVGQLEMHGLPAFWVKHYRQWVLPGVLMRSSKLSDAELKEVATAGIPIRSILNLCAENDDDTPRAVPLGIRVEHIPMIDNYAATPQQIDFCLAWINDKQNQPALVHCEAGVGRTGVIVACWRVSRGMPVEHALREAKAYGQMDDEQEACVRAYAALPHPVVV